MNGINIVASNKEPNSNTGYWTYQETTFLLKFISYHCKDLKNEKNQTWKLISNELKLKGFSRSNHECIKKWNELRHAFNRNRNQPNSKKIKFLFYDEIELIFKTSPELVENEDLDDVVHKKLLVKSLKGKHIWEYEETILFLRVIKEANIAKLEKKEKWEFIVEVLNCKGYNVTMGNCQSKWRNLVRAYLKVCTDLKQGGEVTTKFLFFDQMNDLIGNRGNEILNIDEKAEIRLEIDKSCSSDLNEEPEEPDLEDDYDNEVNTSPLNSPFVLNEKQFCEYIKLKKQEYKRKDKRHAEKMEVLKEKNNLQKRKLDLLEIYLKNKK